MTKNISLSEDVYALLNSIKSKDESFSEVIRRLTGNRNKGRLIEIIDLYPELSDVSEYEESIKELRKQIDEELGLRA